jgi:hypothetical protein
MASMSCSEYLRAANFVRQRAAREQNPGAKEILQEIARSYRRLVEMEDWWHINKIQPSICSFQIVRRRVVPGIEASPVGRIEPGRTHDERDHLGDISWGDVRKFILFGALTFALVLLAWGVLMTLGIL